jgi:hypothetical protein
MAIENIFQHAIFTRFALPFLLIFFIVFAILEKTKILGDGKQINALVSFVIGIVFIGFTFPVEVLSNLVLFLTISLVVMFIGLMIWGFVAGESPPAVTNSSLRWIFGIVIAIAVIIALLWATGAGGPLTNFLFKQDWSGGFWTNLAFIVVIGVALGVAIKSSGSG